MLSDYPCIQLLVVVKVKFRVRNALLCVYIYLVYILYIYQVYIISIIYIIYTRYSVSKTTEIPGRYHEFCSQSNQRNGLPGTNWA